MGGILVVGLAYGLGAGSAASEEPRYDPTAPPTMDRLGPEAESESQDARAPWTTPPEEEEEAEDEAEPGGLQMVRHKDGGVRPEQRSSLIDSQQHMEGDEWAGAPLVHIRRYGVNVQTESDTYRYVPVVGHGVEKRRRLPEEPPRVKGK